MMTGPSPQTDPTRPKRSRTRTFLPLGIAAWLVLEIWLLTVVAEAADGFTVFLLLLAGVVVGAAVIKRAGRRAWQNLSRSMQPGAAPQDPAAGSGGSSFTMLGGLLLMMPGLISDVAALVCLFPPTRALLRKRAEAMLSRRVGYVPGPMGGGFGQDRMRRPEGKVIQGEVIRDDEDPHSASRD
ncbi:MULTISPECIES: FxsA family membrane protein [Streptomyces]|uniref:FxsA family membrane protein n=1 Tax=Streptomyces lonegramiae TaxID=3075524 RepID=A0ABU2XHJ8_9ACTN|nr:FxsA family membrane protein [Streptomyces sp. DSM 41529]MDT0545409.1 FxsA family membrane protein [Streptomyces sp. DSM 41529]